MDNKFANWSAENATKAYLNTLRMGVKSANEPNVSEFISAIAAGNNAQVMVVACGGTAGPATLLALVAAAHQTGGRVICIFHDLDELRSAKEALGLDVDRVEFVSGDARRLIIEDYKEADFVLVNCKLENHEVILREMQASGECYKGAIVLGYNAFSSEAWQWAGLRTQLLPIGDGLLLTRVGVDNKKGGGNIRKCGNSSFGRNSHWVVKVDRHTGEEHVFRVTNNV